MSNSIKFSQNHLYDSLQLLPPGKRFLDFLKSTLQLFFRYHCSRSIAPPGPIGFHSFPMVSFVLVKTEFIKRTIKFTHSTYATEPQRTKSSCLIVVLHITKLKTARSRLFPFETNQNVKFSFCATNCNDNFYFC